MNINNIIVMNYLKSLKEDSQLDAIFPMLLHVLGYDILSTPKEYKGFSQYGKDIVAVKEDDDGIKKKFFFELKAGDIDKSNWFIEKNGVRDTLLMTADHEFRTSYADFDNLPKKVVLVFNGMINSTIKELYDGLIKKEFTKKGTEFEEWNIYKLTELFHTNLFNSYLLADNFSSKLFNRVIVNLNSFDGVSSDFEELIDYMLAKNDWKGYSNEIPREWTKLFESLRLIALIIYTESLDYNNLDISKRFTTCIIVKFWSWILRNKLENDIKILDYFKELYLFYYNILVDYLERTFNIASLRNGLSSESGGRYEQIGYTYRTFNYIQNICFIVNFEKYANGIEKVKDKIDSLSDILIKNNVSARPLLDIHSIPIIDVLCLFIEANELEKAKLYLKNILGYLRYGKNTHNRLPDANNNIKSVIKLEITGEKSVFYSDSTSPLLGVLFEFLVILNMKKEFSIMQEFVAKNDIHIAIFIPHHGKGSTSKDLRIDKENDLEEILFSGYFNEGYQSQIVLTKNITEQLSFKEFKNELIKLKDEFEYDYRCEKVGFGFINSIAHNYYKTPYFPDKWRCYL